MRTIEYTDIAGVTRPATAVAMGSLPCRLTLIPQAGGLGGERAVLPAAVIRQNTYSLDKHVIAVLVDDQWIDALGSGLSFRAEDLALEEGAWSVDLPDWYLESRIGAAS